MHWVLGLRKIRSLHPPELDFPLNCHVAVFHNYHFPKLAHHVYIIATWGIAIGYIHSITAWGYQEVVNSWSWPGFGGKLVEIEVYSGGDEVELFLNGKSLGKKPAGKDNRYLAHFETTYEPGCLQAVTYVAGVEHSRSELITAGAPTSIRLTPDRTQISVGGEDLSFVTVELLDEDGNLAHHADNSLYFTVSGAGALQAVGNGNPVSEEMYVGATRRVHYGRAMAVVKSGDEAGQMILNVSAEGMPAAQATICVSG